MFRRLLQTSDKTNKSEHNVIYQAQNLLLLCDIMFYCCT